MKTYAILHRAVSLVCILTLLRLPFNAIAQGQSTNDVYVQAITDARYDAASNSAIEWMAAGCCIGVFGVILAAIVDPSPPVQRFIGKSPEYINIYTQEYQRSARRNQIESAVGGCIIGAVSVGVYYVFILPYYPLQY